MNKRGLTSVFTILIAAAVAYGVSRINARPAMPTMNQLQEADWLTKELALTATQAEAVRKLSATYVAQLQDCCERHCAARAALGDSFFKPGQTEDADREAMEAVCHAQRDSDLATLQHIRRIHALLTPEQQKKYERLVSDCLCEECPNGFEHNNTKGRT